MANLEAVVSRIIDGLDAAANRFHDLGEQAEEDRQFINKRYAELKQSDLRASFMESSRLARMEFVTKVLADIIPQATPVRESTIPSCPDCGKVLERVRYEGGYLNEDQFDSVRAGDFYCTVCKGTRAKTGYRYFWNRELGIP